MSKLTSTVLWAAVAGMLAAGLGGCPDRPLEIVDQPLSGGLDVTFFVAADTHIGWNGAFHAPDNLTQLGIEDIVVRNERQVTAMNHLPGQLYPWAIGGTVNDPRGVLIAGDLTNDGKAAQLADFRRLYGTDSTDGLLRYPVFEATGNHDRGNGLSLGLRQTVARSVQERHGRLDYSWDWDDLHVVCLDEYPDAGALRFLRGDLAAVGRRRPVVIFFHFGLDGPYSNWWSQREKRAFATAIAGFNVVGIFHGHYHASEHYTWEGYDVYNVGSPRHSARSFAVVHVTDQRMTVGEYNWDRADWGWVHVKPIGLP